MPTSAWRRTAGGLPLSALNLIVGDYPRPNDHIIHTTSWCAIGEDFMGLQNGTPYASSTYPAASRAQAVPFEIAFPFLVRKVFWMNGTTATTDSIDVGVYTEAGTRLVSGGGTAVSGANATQEVDVTDTLLHPGRYWLAYAQNGVTATPMAVVSGAALFRAAGGAQMASAYVLPTTFTPAGAASGVMPLCGIASRTLVS
jgi:hypothetical protein